ncbi:hypothetical protein SERLA73DRAFT_129866, partial [Serpula lacrymans var. lacrymans S7.3]
QDLVKSGHPSLKIHTSGVLERSVRSVIVATDKLFTKFFHSYILYTLFYI